MGKIPGSGKERSAGREVWRNRFRVREYGEAQGREPEKAEQETHSACSREWGSGQQGPRERGTNVKVRTEIQEETPRNNRDTEGPSHADGGRGRRQKPRERQSERCGDRPRSRSGLTLLENPTGQALSPELTLEEQIEGHGFGDSSKSPQTQNLHESGLPDSPSPGDTSPGLSALPAVSQGMGAKEGALGLGGSTLQR